MSIQTSASSPSASERPPRLTYGAANWRGRRAIALRICLLAIGLLLACLLLEITLRFAGPLLPGAYQTASFTMPSGSAGRVNRPNSAGLKRTSEFTTWVRVNSNGLRGPEVPYDKPPDAFRILVLGDSFTFALQVDEEQSFVQQLAMELGESHPGLRIETINAGVDGWGTFDQYHWLVSEGYRYEPDLVLLMYFVGNDPGDNANLVGGTMQLDLSRFSGRRYELLDGARERLRQHSMAYNVVEQSIQTLLPPAATAFDQDDGLLDGRPMEDVARELLGLSPDRTLASVNSLRKIRGWMITEELLGRMRDFCGEHGARLAVVGIPTADNVTATVNSTTPLPELSSRSGLPYVELLTPFREQSRRVRERLYFQQNRHWTAEAHRLAARITAAELLRLRLVPTGSG